MSNIYKKVFLNFVVYAVNDRNPIIDLAFYMEDDSYESIK